MGLRALVVVWILCATVIARGDPRRLPVVKDSRSIILRATHIAIVEIVAATDDGVDAEQRPMTKLGVRVVEILKGTIDGDHVVARVVHYPPGTPELSLRYGAWRAELRVGARFVVFANAPTQRLAELVVDPNVMYVFPPEAADGVRLANEVHALSLTAALAKATPRAASLDGPFAEYLIARDHTAGDVEAFATFMELPALASEARTTLVMDAEVWSRGAGAVRDRLAIAMFRILRDDAAAALRDNLIGTWIPNLLDNGDDKRTAAQVFRGHARERALARAAVDAYHGDQSGKPLRDWLAR